MSFKMLRPKGLEDWESSVPTEIVEKAKQALKDNYYRFFSTSNFIGVGKNDLSVHIKRGCHYDMQHVLKSCRTVLATENATSRRSDLSKEVAQPFLKWFLYESPYGFIILNRDDFESCEDYGFVLAGDAPTTLVQCACIISRHFEEASILSFQEFNKLVERGIDGFIAYQICFNSNISSSVYKSENLATSVFVGYSGHRVTQSLSPEVLLNYYRGLVQRDFRKTYQQSPSIQGSSYLFVPQPSPGLYTDPKWWLHCLRETNSDFHNFLLEKENGNKSKDQVYRPPNPFTPKPLNQISPYKFTCLQAVTDVADYLQDFISKELAKDHE